jgi:predicted AlkP superfamily phosphohydrolase/phosphomutase
MIGLDCLVPDVLDGPARELMPTVAAVADAGTGGVLRSTLPPITVPAWTSMLTGRDPGELGIYGFRNRRSYRYGELSRANGTVVRAPRIWDRVGAAGGRSIVVGVPQTSPPPALNGWLICGFEGPVDGNGRYTSPPELADEVRTVCGEYLFDVPDFRAAARSQVLSTVYRMTERRFAVMRHLVTTRPWAFAMLHEIGPDRMHHCFWRVHDPEHPRHDPDSPYRDAIRAYYRYLDDQVAALMAAVGEDTAVLIVSDHGATAMHGGVCVNELLREAGLLVLREDPGTVAPLHPDMVDWSKTAAWAEGGYYARIFFNLAGREPSGTVDRDRAPQLTEEIGRLLSRIELDDGRVLHNRVVAPAQLYRRTRGIPPDLLVFFDAEHWRSVGSVGHLTRWVAGNDTGADEANHSRNGMFALRVPSRRSAAAVPGPADILDVTPTLLDLLDLPPDPDLAGTSLIGRLR